MTDDSQVSIVLDSGRSIDGHGRPELSEFSLCAPDLPGHGRSGTPGSESTVGNAAEVVTGVIDQLNVGRVHIVGHSGFDDLLMMLTVPGRQDLRAWRGWLASCDRLAVHAAAQSLVEWSDTGTLVRYFHSLSKRIAVNV